MAIASSQCKYMVTPNDPVFITPGDMPSRIRQFCQKTNQGDNLSDAQVVRAIYDSLAMYFNKRLSGLEEMLNVKYNTLNIVGGGTKDKLLMQLASNAINKTVIAGPVEATAIGNLLGQAIASGAVDSLASAREIVRTSFDVAVYEPQADSAAIYAATAEKFNAIL
jgi:sugar (pentulose or hexulose) kinase